MPPHHSANARIGRNLAQLRCNRDLSQNGLAGLLGLDRSVLTRIETGVRPLRLSEAVLIAQYTTITLDDLAAGVPIGF